MNSVTDHRPRPSRRAIERELELVTRRSRMVASGGSPRVSSPACASATARSDRRSAMADDAGVRLVPLWSADERGADIVGGAHRPMTDDRPSRPARRGRREPPADRRPPPPRRRATTVAEAASAEAAVDGARGGPPARRSSCSTSTCPATPAGTCSAARRSRPPVATGRHRERDDGQPEAARASSASPATCPSPSRSRRSSTTVERLHRPEETEQQP